MVPRDFSETGSAFSRRLGRIVPGLPCRVQRAARRRAPKKRLTEEKAAVPLNGSSYPGKIKLITHLRWFSYVLVAYPPWRHPSSSPPYAW